MTSPIILNTSQAASPELKRHGSIDAKFEYFNNPLLLVSHPALERAVDDLVWSSRAQHDQNVILFVGPSGVGKSAALRLAQAKLNKGIDLDVDMSSIPALYYEVQASEAHGFDYRNFYIDLLELCREFFPLGSLETIERAAGKRTVSTINFRAVRGPWSASEAALAARVRNTFGFRGTRLLALDEAVNLLLVTSARTALQRKDRLRRRANVIRSLVNGLPTRIVLAGAYDFLELAYQGSQLARRSNVLPFFEYPMTETGAEEFTIGWTGLTAHLPHDHRDIQQPAFGLEVMGQALGCVGIAKTILGMTLSTALKTGRPITPTLVRDHYYPARALAQMRSEMLAGHASVKSYHEDASFDHDEMASVDFPVAKKTGTAKNRGRVGQIAPRRDFSTGKPT